MSSREKLVAVGSEPVGAERVEQQQAAESAQDEIVLGQEWEEQTPPRRWIGWIVPSLAVLAALGWTGFFGWAHQSAILAGGTPEQWSNWIVAWAVPVLLIVSLWLLAMRHSRREAARFADTASALSRESAALETRLSVINRELSLARDFIAAQARDLDSLGRIAAERITEHAARLQDLIVENSSQVETIGQVSATARENMERLRSDLPVIANSTRDVASQIGQAGNTAHAQLEELVNGFRRLNEFGEASGRQVASLREQIEAALAGFEAQAVHLEDIARTRFAAFEERSEVFRAELDGREVEALAALRRRADALDDELAERHAEIKRRSEEEIDLLRQQVATAGVEGKRVLDTLRGGQDDAARKWAAAIDELSGRMLKAIENIASVDQHALESARARLMALSEEAERVDTTMIERTAFFEQSIAMRREEAEQRESEALIALKGRLEALDAHVREHQEEHLAHVSGLTERGEALVERIQTLTRQLDELAAQGGETGGALEEAAAGLAASLAESRAELVASSTLVGTLTDDSVRLLELIRAGAEHTENDLPRALARAAADLNSFESRIRDTHNLIGKALQQGEALAGHATAIRLEGGVSVEQFATLEMRIAAANRAHADELARLESSLTTIAEKSEVLAQAARGALGEELEGMSGQFAKDSAEVIGQAMREHAQTMIAELEAAAASAGEASRETAVQLRDQLAAVSELAGNLEHRVAHARRKAEEQVDNDFARRMALITESLNSSAIDISKAFDDEVTDTSWASYLRGDRGIFTRRAVKLIDAQTSREVSDIYGADGEFRETVNRYIHDFEAMLRSVLSTRDGHALGVTLLSSDPGRLYVALAQAIERLRD